MLQFFVYTCFRIYLNYYLIDRVFYESACSSSVYKSTYFYTVEFQYSVGSCFIFLLFPPPPSKLINLMLTNETENAAKELSNPKRISTLTCHHFLTAADSGPSLEFITGYSADYVTGNKKAFLLSPKHNILDLPSFPL